MDTGESSTPQWLRKKFNFYVGMIRSKMPLSWPRRCWCQEEAKVVLPQSPAPSLTSQEGGEMADGTSATGMDWMDLNVQLGLVATGRGKATNSSSKGISPQVTRDRIQKRQLPCDKQPGDNVQRGHWDWGNIPFARCQHPEQEQAPSQSIAAGTWAGHHCCWEEGDCHQLMAPASLQQQHKAQQLLPAQPSLNCCHCTREKGREGQALPHVWDERSGAGSSQPRAGGCNFQQGGHC